MSTIYLSENANELLKKYLRDKGHCICEIKRTDAVYDAVSSHADIYLCPLSCGLVVAQEQYALMLEQLVDQSENRSSELNELVYTIGSSPLGFEYPENVKYNAVQMGKHFIHNIKYTDKLLLDMAKRLKLNIIPVKQGYTKCNMVVLDDQSAITSDAGLAKALISNGIDVLTITPGHVRLKGFPYGFLGGTSGRVGDEILFNGNLSAHPDYVAIKAFIKGKSLKIKDFEEYPLEDIGSILQINYYEEF